MAEVRPGQVLAGKYRVERVLGEGGMGVVVAATRLALDDRVALKFMLPAANADPEAAKRFQREAKAAVKLRSEHVAKVLDVGVLEDGAPYIVMEYLEGEDLGQVLDALGPLTVEQIAEYVIQACDAIAEAHAAGVIHRDLKPSNLFITKRPDGGPLVKVLDFGISKSSGLGDSNLSMTKTNTMLGSPLYMSPEQMKSARDVDAQTDVWSLGVILYELATGQLPYDAPTVGALMARVFTEKPTPIESLRKDLPKAFVRLVERCLESDPARRCRDVAEIVSVLAAFAPERSKPISDRIATVLRNSSPALRTTGHVDAMPGAARGASADDASAPSLPRVTSSSWARTPEGSPRRPVLIAAAAAAVLAAVLGVGFVATRGKAQPGAGLTPATEPSAAIASAAPVAPPASVEAAPRSEPALAAPAAPAAPAPAASSSAPAPARAPAPAKAAPKAPAVGAPAAPPTTAKPTKKGNDLLKSWD